jgi:hypothetical protein
MISWEPGDDLYDYMKALADLDKWWRERARQVCKEAREKLDREADAILRRIED